MVVDGRVHMPKCEMGKKVSICCLSHTHTGSVVVGKKELIFVVGAIHTRSIVVVRKYQFMLGEKY